MPTRACVNNSTPVQINFSAAVGAYFTHTPHRTRRRHHHHQHALSLAIDRSASKVADRLVQYVSHSSNARIPFHPSMKWVGESESPHSTVRYVSVACAEGGRRRRAQEVLKYCTVRGRRLAAHSWRLSGNVFFPVTIRYSGMQTISETSEIC